MKKDKIVPIAKRGYSRADIFVTTKEISKTEKCRESQNAEEYGDISSGNTENLVW